MSCSGNCMGVHGVVAKTIHHDTYSTAVASGSWGACRALGDGESLFCILHWDVVIAWTVELSFDSRYRHQGLHLWRHVRALMMIDSPKAQSSPNKLLGSIGLQNCSAA